MKQSSGGYVVLITVLVVGAFATTVGVLLLLTGMGSAITSSGVAAHTQTKGAALGCANLALARIKNEPLLTTPASDSFTLDEGTQTDCSYTIDGSSPDYSITITGRVRASSDNYVSRLLITVDQVTPLHVSSWQVDP